MPDKLYKYCRFSVNSLRAITEAEVYYAEPRTFNDPLDCDPSLHIDIDRKHLERLLYRMLKAHLDEDKAKARMYGCRRSIGEYGDYRVIDSEAERQLMSQLDAHIRAEMKREFGNDGVLSLSATWRSVLMWSHYADEHRGLCIEYDTSEQPHPRLQPVDYHAPRAVKASDLYRWKVRDDEVSKNQVLKTYFYAKSSEWRYEREWRDISEKSGARDLPFSISAILFGYRCDDSVITSIVKLLNDKPDIKLWSVEPKEQNFKLHRRLVDRDEIEAMGVRSPPHHFLQDLDDLVADFEEVVDNASTDQRTAVDGVAYPSENSAKP
ncbi:MAG: DUF2971 domain-containing protein [Pseudomonadota bacterium]